MKKPDTIKKCIINMIASFVDEGMSTKEAEEKARRGMDFIDSSEDETHPTYALRHQLPAWRAVFGSKKQSTNTLAISRPAADIIVNSGVNKGCPEPASTVEGT